MESVEFLGRYRLTQSDACFKLGRDSVLLGKYERLKIGGVESRLRELGRRLELPRVHPHKFRRTLATVAIDKGMPVEQLQRLLGHQRIDTTLQYAMVKQSNVKLAHRKFLG